MKHTWRWLILLIVVAGSLPACGRSTGEKLVQERCAVCHSLDRVELVQKSRQGWERTVSRMVGKGADLNEDEQAAVIEYLVEIYGR